jgi:hypothetical protein
MVWGSIDKRLERNHPTTALGKLRVYGSDISNDVEDFDISKIHYYKGGFINKGEVKEIHRPKAQSMIDQPVLRAQVYLGLHHHDLVEDLEEKMLEPIAAIKAQVKQYRNPRVDVTNPDPNEIHTGPGQLWAQPKVADVTHGPFHIRFRDDLTNWPDLVKMRFGDVTTPSTGDFLGEEFFVYEDAPTRTRGTKYFWNGLNWSAMASSGGGGGGGGITGTGVAGRVALWDSPTNLTNDAGLTYDPATYKLTITGTVGTHLRLAYDGSTYVEFRGNSVGTLLLSTTGTYIDWTRSASGTSINFQISNPSNTAGSAALYASIVGGASSGDPFYTVIVAGLSSWSWGLDNSVNDAFKISWATGGGAASLGTNDFLTITTAGSVVLGNAALLTVATDGFLYIAGCPGTPTGVPATETGRNALTVDHSGNKLHFYSGGAWREAGGGAGAVDIYDIPLWMVLSNLI